ncbi:anaerobic ribonucleoside-triphosphate reductase activating protein [uncultured Robinsoniella sp.]|uniref:anaerobic ribonucleoside-triphosphate reductase activating protein n=1 Tax=uncultured Robinsoniella sp. TaxID=904190 RepID=UPI00374F5F8A
MKIHGFNKLTLLDYPGHLGATLFLGSCNFRCPFCQNAGLVLNPESEPYIEEGDVLAYLKKRLGILEGVCITGGEPTLSKELPGFIEKIKSLGYLVKLDTNGSNPAMIRSLVEDGLIDYVAMDIKSSPENYSKVAGCVNLKMDAIQESVSYVMSCSVDYEFRTTVVRELHTAKDFYRIGEWLHGCRQYFLQAYKDSENVIQSGFHSYTRKELEEFAAILKEQGIDAGIRGLDD